MTTPTDPPPGWRVGTISGVPVHIARSWLIVAAVVVLTFGPNLARAMPDLGALAYAVALAYAILLLLSVLAHEAGHAIVAQRLGHRVTHIVADLMGGHTAYHAASNTPGRSALVAISGPLMNAALAAAAYLAHGALAPGTVPSLLVGALCYSNAFVAVFNLLPGLPLDGGFLVDSLVWKITGSRANGMLVAGWTGRLIALAVVYWLVVRPFLAAETPDITSIMWTALIASFLWQGATSAIRGSHLQRVVSAVPLHTVVRPTISIPTTATIAQALAMPRAEGAAPVAVDAAGRAVGLVGSIDDIPPERYASTPVSAVTVALPEGAVVEWRDSLSTTDVISRMGALEIGVVLVTDAHGRYGMVRASDVDDILGHPITDDDD